MSSTRRSRIPGGDTAQASASRRTVCDADGNLEPARTVRRQAGRLGLRQGWSPRLLRHHLGSVALVALFTFLTLAFAGIAVGGATAGRWVIALGAAAIAAWMGSFAWAAVRRARR